MSTKLLGESEFKMNMTFEELERKYYIEGNVEKAKLFAILDEQELTIDYLQEEIKKHDSSVETSL